MSMNFGREQALLRQRLTEKGTPERVSEQQARYGDKIKCLGATDDEVQAAAHDLVEQFPGMGRAQMTAFVRTLWGSKTHELRAAGAAILTAKADLLEPHDLAFVEGLLKDGHDEGMQRGLAEQVLGGMVLRHKKLWKDLQRMAKTKNTALQLSAVQASKAPCAQDAAVFDRFAKLAAPLVSAEDAALQAALDEVLVAAKAQDAEAVQAFADEHGRELG